MGRRALYGILSGFAARMAVNPINGDEKISPALAIRLARKFLGEKVLADIFFRREGNQRLCKTGRV